MAADSASSDPPKPNRQASREAREAQALRENLLRRKARAQALRSDGGEQTPDFQPDTNGS